MGRYKVKFVRLELEPRLSSSSHDVTEYEIEMVISGRVNRAKKGKEEREPVDDGRAGGPGGSGGGWGDEQ